MITLVTWVQFPLSNRIPGTVPRKLLQQHLLTARHGMSMIRRLLLVWLLATTVVTVHGWGKQGHQIVDNLA
jgi:hypothetical protein